MVLQPTKEVSDQNAEELQNRLQQQAFVAELGQRALAGRDLQALMDEAVQMVAKGLRVDYTGILQYDEPTYTLRLRAGVGWREGLVGSARVGAGKASQAGFTLLSAEPVIVKDLRTETRFLGSQLLAEHGVTSGLSVIIPGGPHPYGAFGVHTKSQRIFTKEDVNFVEGVVNVLATSVARKKMEDALRVLNQDLDRIVNERTALVHLLQDVTSAANDAETISEAMRVALEKICKFTGFPLGHVFVSVGEDTKKLVSSPIWHFENSPSSYDALRKASDPLKISLGEGVLGQVFASGQRLWVSDLRAMDVPRFQAAFELGLEAALFLPVLVKKEIVAVLEFFAPRTFEVGEDFLDALSNIGTQLGRIVERRRAAEELFDKEQRLAEAQHIAQLGSWEWDIRRNGLRLSEELQQIFGISQPEFTGGSEAFLDRVHPEDREIVRDSIQTALANASPFQLEHRIIRPDGEVRVLQGRGKVIIDLDGKAVKMIGTEQDVTERIQAQRALRESERRYRQVLESVKDYAIFTLDPHGYVTSWNPGAERIKGFRAADVIGKHFSIFYIPEDIEKGEPQISLQNALKDGQFETEGWRLRKDGDRYWANVLITPIWDDQGNLQGFSKVVRDITRRRQTEEALRASEARFRTIFEGSAMGIAILDLDGNLLIGNPALQRILDYTRGEIKGLSLEQITDASDQAIHAAMFRELADGKRELFRHEGRFRKKDGGVIWGNWSVSLVRDSDGKPLYVISMIEDITYRKLIQSELLEVQRQLDAGREQERLRLAQELHDDPLQELYGIIYQIEAVNTALASPEIHDDLHGMRSSVQNVIDKLRAICGELRPPALTPFGLESAIREHADTFRSQHPEIRLHLDLAYDGQNLSEQLRLALFRVYQQAIANVARHSQAKNAIVRFKFDEQGAVLEIEDDGQGFVVPSNWVSFTRKKHLGLAGAAERAELLGGKLEIISAPGKGALVRLSVPSMFTRELEDEG